MMATLIHLAIKSLLYRKKLLVYVVAILTLNFGVVLSFDRVKHSLSGSFTGAVSGVDLIVGAPTGPLNLALYTLFNMGAASNNIDIKAFEEWSKHPGVEWAVPISLGDSHRGYRVVATTADYFKYFKVRDAKNLEFINGSAFSELYDVVLGYEVAEKLGYQLGDLVVVSHGSAGGYDGFLDHADKPFQVSGVLARTQTPVDQSLYISLKAMEAIHIDWDMNEAQGSLQALEPTAITAFFVKIKSRIEALRIQRQINEDKRPGGLLAILPTVTLSELWRMMGFFEKAIGGLGYLVLLISLVALIFIFIYLIESRNKETALLRAIGFSKAKILALLGIEVFTLLVVSIFLSLVIDQVVFGMSQQLLLEHFGLWMGEVSWPWQSLYKLIGMSVVTLFVVLVVGLVNLRSNLKQGLGA